MSSIVTAVFCATVGWLVNKGRDVASEKLKEGDGADYEIHRLITREVEGIRLMLVGLSKNDLLAAVDFFESGMKFLYRGIDKERTGAPTAETTAVSETIQNIGQACHFDKISRDAFSEAKKRFRNARQKATDASNNPNLSPLEVITAIRCRVMAAMLESAMKAVVTADMGSPLTVQNAVDNALPECEQCLQKLHSLPAVQKSFKVELEKGPRNIKGRFGKDKRREVISLVCQVNRAIYDVMSTVGKDWSCVDTGEDKVDPLRDGRVIKVLRKVGMEHCYVPWSFGQEGEEEHKLKDPVGITTNTDGQFIIADNGDKTLKVFDSNGKFHLRFNLQTDNGDTNLKIQDVATDFENNTYLLVELKKFGVEEYVAEVHVYTNNSLLHKFPVRRGVWSRLTVSGSKVLVLGDNKVVVVYEHSKRNGAEIKR